MKIAVSAYSFQQYVRSGKMTQLDCVKKAKEMGFEAIEFTDIAGNDLEEQKAYAREIRKAADEAGMKIVAYAIGACLYKDTEEEMQAEVERLKGQLEVAKILDVDVMRHDVCYSLGKKGKSRSFDLMLPDIAKNARLVSEYGESLGIRTCTENHGFIAQDSDRVERLFNAVAHDNYGLLVDVGNFACADESSITAVSRVAPYAIHVHVKDMCIRKEPSEAAKNQTRGGNYLACTAVGEGDIPVKQCLAILKKAGYDGYVSIEYEGAEDCMSGIARGFENLKKMIEELN